MTRRETMYMLLRVQDALTKQLRRAQPETNKDIWDAIGIAQRAFTEVFHDTNFMLEADVPANCHLLCNHTHTPLQA
jgi:hypothetical protein